MSNGHKKALNSGILAKCVCVCMRKRKRCEQDQQPKKENQVKTRANECKKSKQNKEKGTKLKHRNDLRLHCRMLTDPFNLNL